MTRHGWARLAGSAAALLIALAIIYGLLLIGMDVPTALLAGWLVSGIACLGIGGWRRDADWIAPGFIFLGGALVAALIETDVLTWWWPLGLVTLGVVYMAVANILSDQLATSWRAALELSAFFIAGVGAVWEGAQIVTAFVLAAQGTPLLAVDANPLRESFLLSSLLLVAGSLLWAQFRRRWVALALTALLVGQLAFALIVNATEVGDPSAAGLFALALLVVAFLCHVSTYFPRVVLPDLAPRDAPKLWPVLLRRGGRARAAQMLKALPNADVWGLCVLLDGCALLFAILALLPVAAQPSAHSPNSAPLLIVLSAGALLSAAIAYWQQTPWLLLLAGSFLALDIYALGLFAVTPASTWPLLYFAATTGFLGLAIWLRSFSERAWALSSLLTALGSGGLALTFAMKHQSLAWGLGMALALAAAAAVSFWGWRMAQGVRQP